MQVKFGTDGWRAIIAKDYTYENLKLAALASARYFQSQPGRSKGVCIGYDTRFMSKEFAEYTAEVLSSAGIRVFLSDSFVSTPAVSLYTKAKQLAGGIVITASHNPPNYNGFKVKAAYGGPANPEAIAEIESNLLEIDPKTEIKPDMKLIESVDMKSFYMNYLKTHVDLQLIRESRIKIAHNAMYGAGQDIITRLFDESMVNCYHCTINPGFGGINPEPMPQYIEEFVDFFKEVETDVAIINDGDADRVGMLDEKARFVDSHKLFAIILKYLVEERHQTGEVAKTFALTDVINKICRKNNLVLHELPVGFKYVSKLMSTNDILIGGEESGGIGITSFLPERDGVYIGLLILEIMTRKEKSLSGLVEELYDEYGYFAFTRNDLHVSEAKKQAIIAKAAAGNLETVAGYKVLGFSDLDGYKYHFEGGWLLIRPSGTEPVLRLYCEADTDEKVSKVLAFAAKLA
ncbi:phosphoglucomutase/phosphomannomutase family protein [Chlorobium phaeobacteroides]|jgi:phosphomannomutase|uniref:Phosphomannomutase n=1 Tax=Chlorobium phaeobacteroides (strain DSM 266 / SMG 266 / 2430) TaxID=290317 RepID=A1BDJ1_CHLPD|nr:phosphoglucomutase/phosphomannomutase family protein [Chlorobium phaeobacteroides]ABL64468.1 Phosphomannomutase [Chlorobium phaeobacteroides DSM 266]MBV5319765.1 phosphoglucomutase/phosphomannomutase family protein [Chlorobium phaeobacteroides]